MAYDGYRLKINGEIFPNNYISKGSYQLTEEKRVVEIWKDANHVEHEVTTGTEKAEITFAIREHNTAEHDDLMHMLRPEHDIVIEFWSDLWGEYRTGNFRRSKFTFRHLNVDPDGIIYASVPVTFTED